MIDVRKLIGEAISSYTIVSFQREFGVDVATYSWVSDYLQDKRIREEIEAHRQQIRELRAAPIAKDELRAQFEEVIKNLNRFKLNQLTAHLKEVQNRTGAMMNSYMLGERKYIGGVFDPYMISLSKEDIEFIFSQLPEGMKQADIDTSIKSSQDEIISLEAELEEKYNQRNRWWYSEDGKPYKYPVGCRWTAFVTVWKGVAARFSTPVTIEGYPLESEDETMAYQLLELDKVRKIEPLRSARSWDPRRR